MYLNKRISFTWNSWIQSNSKCNQYIKSVSCGDSEKRHNLSLNFHVGFCAMSPRHTAVYCDQIFINDHGFFYVSFAIWNKCSYWTRVTYPDITELISLTNELFPLMKRSTGFNSGSSGHLHKLSIYSKDTIQDFRRWAALEDNISWPFSGNAFFLLL